VVSKEKLRCLGHIINLIAQVFLFKDYIQTRPTEALRGSGVASSHGPLSLGEEAMPASICKGCFKQAFEALDERRSKTASKAFGQNWNEEDKLLSLKQGTNPLPSPCQNSNESYISRPAVRVKSIHPMFDYGAFHKGCIHC
jgi:hypothetical protein